MPLIVCSYCSICQIRFRLLWYYGVEALLDAVFFLSGIAKCFAILRSIQSAGTRFLLLFIFYRILFCSSTATLLFCTRRDGRAVECGGLENRWLSQVRGFESLSLRQTSSKPTKFRGFFVFQTNEACFSAFGEQKTCGEAARVLSEVWRPPMGIMK